MRKAEAKKITQEAFRLGDRYSEPESFGSWEGVAMAICPDGAVIYIHRATDLARFKTCCEIALNFQKEERKRKRKKKSKMVKR